MLAEFSSAVDEVLSDADLLVCIMSKIGLEALAAAPTCRAWSCAAREVEKAGSALQLHHSFGGFYDAYHEDEEFTGADDDASTHRYAYGLSVTRDGNITVLDQNNARVILLAPDGLRLRTLYLPHISSMTVGAENTVYYTSGLNQCSIYRMVLKEGNVFEPLGDGRAVASFLDYRELEYAADIDVLFVVARQLDMPGGSSFIKALDGSDLSHKFDVGDQLQGTELMHTLAYSLERSTLFVPTEDGHIHLFDMSSKQTFQTIGKRSCATITGFKDLNDIAVCGTRLFTVEARGPSRRGRLSMLTLDGVPLQVLHVHAIGSPYSVCATKDFVHVLCNVDATKDDLLHLGGQRTYADDYARDHGGRDPPLQEWHESSKDWDDLGDDMHSFVSFRVRNGETES